MRRQLYQQEASEEQRADVVVHTDQELQLAHPGDSYPASDAGTAGKVDTAVFVQDLLSLDDSGSEMDILVEPQGGQLAWEDVDTRMAMEQALSHWEIANHVEKN